MKSAAIKGLTSKIYLDSTLPIAQRVDDLRVQMTLTEKIAQLGSVFIYNLLEETGFSLEKANRLSDGIGQVTRLGTYSLFTPCQRAEIANSIQAYLVNQTRLGIPAIFHDECCSGFAALGATRFPQMIGLSSTFRPDLAEAMSAEIGKQMRATGSHQGLAPVLDLYRDPRWGRVEETFGEDPGIVARFGVAYVRGLQGSSLKDGVMATGKHFIAHSVSEGGLNCTPVHLGQREIRESFLPPYEAVIHEANLATMMNSYSELDGRVVAADKTILRDLLRDELGFDGLLVSDYLAIEMLHNFHQVAIDLSEAAVKALRAGINLELPETNCYGEPLRLAIANGEVDEALINEAVQRVLTKKFELGLFEQPFVQIERVDTIYQDPRPLELAREIAGQSLVLLKNEDDLLPISRTPGTLAVIGPNADAGRHYLSDYSYPAMNDILLDGTPGLLSLLEATGSQTLYQDAIEQIPTVLEAVRKIVSPETQVLYTQGCNNNGDDSSGFAEAVAAAKQADVILLVLGDRSGLTPGCTSGEFNDRASLNLPGIQEELVKAILSAVPGKPIVAVLINGRPLAITWLSDQIPAILEAWMPGEQGAPAIADALFGILNPGGKLTVTLPRSVGQLPIFYNHKPSGGRSFFRGDYADLSTEPLFCFGHGLSYTCFEYSDLKLDAELHPGGVVRASCQVRNVGKRIGDEVVQLYIQDEYACVPRPVKELKGFRRMRLDPGQAARVTFNLSAEHLAYYDEGMHLVVEPGPIRVMLGSSSADIRLEGAFNVVEKIPVKQRSTQIIGTYKYQD
jgi:beta-glucosidase